MTENEPECVEEDKDAELIRTLMEQENENIDLETDLHNELITEIITEAKLGTTSNKEEENKVKTQDHDNLDNNKSNEEITATEMRSSTKRLVTKIEDPLHEVEHYETFTKLQNTTTFTAQLEKDASLVKLDIDRMQYRILSKIQEELNNTVITKGTVTKSLGQPTCINVSFI